MRMLLRSFFSTSSVLQNCYRASISNIGRPLHIKDYIVEVMRSDGSIVPARVSEPFQLIQLPADIKTMSEDERRQRLAARKIKVKVVKEEVIDDNFDLGNYENLWKN
uniref:39S ribosomal protein L55, mitochondrial (inferred by orthology to a human protein) n=1 Tax=Strongyloides venezuelensis TaxID=75913 RepID=A0A0K0G1S2_STRVS